VTANGVTDALLWRRGRERLNIHRVLLTRNAIGKLKAGVVGGSPNTRDRFRGTTSIIRSPHVAALNAVNVQGTSSDLFLICSGDKRLRVWFLRAKATKIDLLPFLAPAAPSTP
jgi:hypothetical protein